MSEEQIERALGQNYPELSPRSDIIVLVDEAHRTQYRRLAENMREGLKNAHYFAFTGTPLLGFERKTNQWFGDYVSEYGFQQSVDDGATLPLFYEKRVPQVLMQNEVLTDELAEICEDENLDDAQRAKRLQSIIDRYNAGSSSADNAFEELVKFTQALRAESERHIRDGLTEEELELFDLLKKPKLTKEETQKVRLAAKALLHRLREESPRVLVQDWSKDSGSRGRVRAAVESVLDTHLPRGYDRAAFTAACSRVFDSRHRSRGVYRVCLREVDQL
ncbi:MAG TPA: DUF3387 domain-containing protein, partial [Verrucomicrobiota bacterium]|nr:DUF3387 domain-containing protein [Verrucomicrobiota bacterium]